MEKVVVKTQKELDSLPQKFDNFTVIEIRSTTTITIKNSRGNSRAELWDNSRAVLWGNSSAVLWGNSSAELHGNSSAELHGNSSAVLWGNSRAALWGNSSAVLWGNSRAALWDNSRAELWDNSRAALWDNSRAVLWGNSSADLFISSSALVLSSCVVLKKLLDHSTAVFKGCPVKIEEKSETAHAREIPDKIEVTFEQWLERGYIYADGITKKLKSRKKIKEIEIFECEEFLDKTPSYVVKKGDTFSHGKTIKEAVEDLKYKISNRDFSEFEVWKNKLDDKISIDDAIAGYRVITGACEFGVKEFVKSIKIPKTLTPNKVIELTKGQFGNEVFSNFLTGASDGS